MVCYACGNESVTMYCNNACKQKMYRKRHTGSKEMKLDIHDAIYSLNLWTIEDPGRLKSCQSFAEVLLLLYGSDRKAVKMPDGRWELN